MNACGSRRHLQVEEDDKCFQCGRRTLFRSYSQQYQNVHSSVFDNYVTVITVAVIAFVVVYLLQCGVVCHNGTGRNLRDLSSSSSSCHYQRSRSSTRDRRFYFFSSDTWPTLLFAHAQCPTAPVLLRNNSYILISNCHQDFMFEEVSPFIPISNLTLEVRDSTVTRVFYMFYPTINFVLLAVNSSMRRAAVIINATHHNFSLRGENSLFQPFGTEGSIVLLGPQAVQMVDSSIVFVNCTINLVQQQLFVSYAPVIGFLASFVNTKLYIEGTSSSLDWAVIDLTHSVTRATSMYRQILVEASNSTFESKGANRKYILMRVVSPTRTSVVGQVHHTDDIVVDMTAGAVRCLVSWSRLLSVTSQQHPSPLRGAVHHMKNITVQLRDVVVENLRDALILLENITSLSRFTAIIEDPAEIQFRSNVILEKSSVLQLTRIFDSENLLFDMNRATVRGVCSHVIRLERLLEDGLVIAQTSDVVPFLNGSSTASSRNLEIRIRNGTWIENASILYMNNAIVRNFSLVVQDARLPPGGVLDASRSSLRMTELIATLAIDWILFLENNLPSSIGLPGMSHPNSVIAEMTFYYFTMTQNVTIEMRNFTTGDGRVAGLPVALVSIGELSETTCSLMNSALLIRDVNLFNAGILVSARQAQTVNLTIDAIRTTVHDVQPNTTTVSFLVYSYGLYKHTVIRFHSVTALNLVNGIGLLRQSRVSSNTSLIPVNDWEQDDVSVQFWNCQLVTETYLIVYERALDQLQALVEIVNSTLAVRRNHSNYIVRDT